MSADSQNSFQSGERACDTEPIHIPGSIQPHGLLLLFDAVSGELSHWAGDFQRLMGAEPRAGLSADGLFGPTLCNVMKPGVLPPGREPLHVGCLRSRCGASLALMAHRTGRFVAVELFEGEDEGTATSALDRVASISRGIASQETLFEACEYAASQVRRIVGFDSVMVYRFLDDCSGAVVAESRAEHAAAYLGHRFPASDIPSQARELYRRNLIRTVPNVDYQPATIEPAFDGPPVDMSHCILRSVSPVHIQYLKNMGVGASMSVSLLVDGELWGLIACHHYGPRSMSLEGLLLCQHVGTSLSAFVLSSREAESARLAAVQSLALDGLLDSLRSSPDPERGLRTSADELKTLLDCGGFVLLGQGELIAGAGQFPAGDQLRELSSLIEARLDSGQSFATDRLDEASGFASALSRDASGVLAVRLEASSPLLAVWLRPEQVEEIAWAGEPPKSQGGPKPLTPRRSFATWREIVRGRSRPWLQREVDAVEMFRTQVGYAMQRHRLNEVNVELRDANALLNELATTDPLTGLPNRRLFEVRLHEEWDRALRHNGQVALIAIDVDHFKKYNDSFGHPAGDECLKKVAKAIEIACRSIDVAARLGGEEFALLLPGIDPHGAALVAERVRAEVERLGLDHPHHEYGVVTISLGVAVVSPCSRDNASALLSAADRALYQAKASGRNSVAVSTFAQKRG